MTEIIDGKGLAKKIRENLKKDVDELRKEGIIPKFAVILVGEDPASKIYVRNKNKACVEIGIEYEEHVLKQDTTMEELLRLIDKLNKDKSINGILLQSPLPQHLDINEALKQIDYKKDVDGFNPVNVGKLSLGQDCFVSCTPYGIIRMLEEYKIPTEGKNAVIIGRSNIVGKPLIQCLLSKNATVTVCHSKTQNIEEITKNSDIIIAAMGKPKFLKGNMVKQGATVIDVGINRMENGKIVGDVDFEEVSKKTSYITPVPGGVGPMTIAMLMNNIKKQQKSKINKFILIEGGSFLLLPFCLVE